MPSYGARGVLNLVEHTRCPTASRRRCRRTANGDSTVSIQRLVRAFLASEGVQANELQRVMPETTPARGQ